MRTPRRSLETKVLCLAAMALIGCSIVVDPEKLEEDPCEDRECGDSPWGHFDCGSCPGETESCSESGECFDDCADLECGLSPTEGYDCGSCDESQGEGCIEGACQPCPAGLSGRSPAWRGGWR